MKKQALVILFLTVSVSMNAQAFLDFINYVNAVPETERQAVADSFIATKNTLPFTEDTLILYIVAQVPAFQYLEILAGGIPLKRP